MTTMILASVPLLCSEALNITSFIRFIVKRVCRRLRKVAGNVRS